MWEVRKESWEVRLLPLFPSHCPGNRASVTYADCATCENIPARRAPCYSRGQWLIRTPDLLPLVLGSGSSLSLEFDLFEGAPQTMGTVICNSIFYTFRAAWILGPNHPQVSWLNWLSEPTVSTLGMAPATHTSWPLHFLPHPWPQCHVPTA